MTPEDFDALFDTFTDTVTRFEALPAYAVADYEGDRLAAFLAGRALPPRTVLTDPWLARIARTSMAGKVWSRVRVVDTPLTEYQRFELEVFKESQAVGEQIVIAERDTQVRYCPDFWLFDTIADERLAVVMDYDPAGQWLGARIADVSEIPQLNSSLRNAQAAAQPLNAFLAVAHA